MPCAAHAAGRTPPPALRRFRLTARVWQHPSWTSRRVGYITAIAEEVFSVMRTAFEEIARADPPPAPGAVLRRVHRDVYRGPLCSAHPGRQGLARLVAQVWVETLRNPGWRPCFARATPAWRQPGERLIRAYQEAGWIPADTTPQASRPVLVVFRGLVMQQAICGGFDVDDLITGLHGSWP